MTEKELMLTSILDCRRTDLYVDAPTLTRRQEGRLAEMQQRRQGGEPLQYILNECEFMGLSLAVDPRVLIPRPETELLVEKVIEKAKGITRRPLEICDIGTGSGNIAISLAKYVEDSFVTAVDVSRDALLLAQQNAQRHGVDHKIKFIHEDMMTFLSSEKPSYDVIVSNPPYIPADQMNRLPLDVQKEPWMALDGGPGGMDYYRMIIAKGAQHLKHGGFLILEIGDGQRAEIEALFQQNPEYSGFNFFKDYRGTDRIVVLEFSPLVEIPTRA